MVNLRSFMGNLSPKRCWDVFVSRARDGGNTGVGYPQFRGRMWPPQVCNGHNPKRT